MFIAVSGNIGAGKTTLVSKLADHFGYHAEYEAVNKNPYLEDFYRDMKRWSFPLQVYFLGHRFRQGLLISELKQGIVLDRTIYEDAHVFAANLRNSGLMSERDYQNYLHLYETMVVFIHPPDVIIYLKGSVTQLSDRVGHRSKMGDRKYERAIPDEYLQDLNLCYHRWISGYQHSPVIEIDIDETDLAEEANFEKLTEKIKEYENA
jgi:deoxyadenosine/deoxycytidine kinase